MIAASIALAGAVVAWRYLPARHDGLAPSTSASGRLDHLTSPPRRRTRARRDASHAPATAMRPGEHGYRRVVTWFTGLGIAVCVLVASWALLVVLARRLPPGLLKDLASVLPACVTHGPPAEEQSAAFLAG